MMDKYEEWAGTKLVLNLRNLADLLENKPVSTRNGRITISPWIRDALVTDIRAALTFLGRAEAPR